MPTQDAILHETHILSILYSPFNLPDSRDCNGVSNGLPLAAEAIDAENAAAAAGDLSGTS